MKNEFNPWLAWILDQCYTGINYSGLRHSPNEVTSNLMRIAFCSTHAIHTYFVYCCENY